MNNSKPKVVTTFAWFLLIILSVLWGGAFFFSKVALSQLQPFTIVLVRVSIAAVILNLIVRVAGFRMPSLPKVWVRYLIMGLLNNLIPFSLIFWGLTQISSSLASILNATTPVWTVLFSHFLTSDERITPNRLIGILIGLIGVVVVIGLGSLQGLGINIFAQLAVIGAAMSYAFAGIYGKRFKDPHPIVTATGQLTCTSLMMIPIALLVDKPWLLQQPDLSVWGAVLGLALLSTALAYVIYFHLLATIGATNVLLVTLLNPISTILLGSFFLGEQLYVQHFIGMGIISVGLFFVDGRILRNIKYRTSRHEK